MNRAFPPSSILTFFIVVAANLESILPTPVEPVKLSFFTLGFVANSLEASRFLVGTTCIIEGGIPASRASLAKASTVNGVSLGGLMTTEHPAANAGATFLVIRAAGKFHGVIIPQTPTGSLNVRRVVFLKDDGIVTP